MQKLIEVIEKGWPDKRKPVEEDLRPYFDVREELVLEDGLILKGERIVIPFSERQNVMKNLHQGHLGRELTLKRAREYVYWPRMNEQIKEMIALCGVCNQHRREQRKEPIHPFDVPSRPWEIVSTDLFVLDRKYYLIKVDHYSNFFENST